MQVAHASPSGEDGPGPGHPKVILKGWGDSWGAINTYQVGALAKGPQGFHRFVFGLYFWVAGGVH